MKCKAAWIMRQYPKKMVLEMEDGNWYIIIKMYPLRELTDKDLVPYLGTKPIDNNGKIRSAEYYGRKAYDFELYGYGLEVKEPASWED